MNILQLNPPDFRVYFRCLLTHAAAVGDTQLQVSSTEQFKQGSFIIIGNINAANTEMVQVDQVISTGAIKLKRALRYAREEETVITLSLFDQFRVYYGYVADMSTHIPLVTYQYNGGGMVVSNTDADQYGIPISVTRSATTHIDSFVEHGPNTFYSYTYYNSFNGNESNRIPIISSGIDTDITPQYIKDNYLYGLDLTEDDGQPLPDGVYWEGIRGAFAWLEQLLHIDILPRTYVDETSDFRREEYLQWIFIKAKHFPVREVTKIMGAYYGNDINFPVDWVRSKDRAGIINLVPGHATFAQFLIPAAGGILPILNNQLSYIPGFWKITYETGFKPGEIPYNLKDLICKRAAFMPLNILGDLVGGVGVASKSIGIDGLSQGLVTTNSAENHGYSARLRMYTAEIKAELPQVTSYWRPISFMSM